MVVVVIGVIYVAANMGAINSFLSLHFDKTKEDGHTRIIVPEAWNLTEEFNMSNSRSNLSFTNNYVIVDVWEDWPENKITSISENRFRTMESGNYKILNKSLVDYGGNNISKEIYSNPTLDTDTHWQHIGVNYVFEREDTNYAMQIHHFSTIDYHNESYMREVEDRSLDLITNIHNKDYNGFFSMINHGLEAFGIKL
ncbi:MAG: hypothetical protein Q4P18_07730 [Methanobrevibacter sp.]|uniref:hypothetical protein n=1 Tax=Methanobrevibacter sp. TaxID=66852 RepID=UPI0026DF531B|nr:hypothetical protein [Methanobrevibacter sp.]MDO5849409.1 hypothetical protein [Methanobrevibacter sp.]